jgi:multimeric flavodoxin WrbA
MKVLAFSASPRIGGNSETLLDHIIEGLESGGATVRKIRTHSLSISPCAGCGGCERNGRCITGDDFQRIYDLLISCDGVVFASPLYFMNVPSGGKALIDRCQSFWIARHRLGLNLFGERRRFGLLAACSGAGYGPAGADVFRGIEDTMTFVFDALALERRESVLVRKVENAGDILERKTDLARAREIGRILTEFV